MDNHTQLQITPIREEYVEGETDPIYKKKYKHFYTPEEAQRAQEK